MQTAHCLLDTSIVVSLIRSALIHTSYIYYFERGMLSTLHMMTMQSVSLGGFIPVTLCLSNLLTHICFHLALNLDIDNLFGITFFNCIICNMLLSEHNVVSRQFRP